MADTEQQPQEEQQQTEEIKKVEEETKPVENGEEKQAEEPVADGEAKPAEDEAGEEAVENGEAEKEEETPPQSLEAPTENPFTDDDVTQLTTLESEEEGWEKVKEKKGVTVYRKCEKSAPSIIKAEIEYAGIPTDKVLEFYTDAELRRKWNKKSCIVDVLEEREDFKIIHSIFKMPTGCDNRDAVQCTMVRSEEDQSRHVILFKSCNHPTKPPKKSFPIRADVLLMGIIIRPKEGEEVGTKVTYLSQIVLKGWMPKSFVNKMSISFPVALFDDLSLYWKKITEPPKSPEKKPEKKKGEKNGEENGEAGEEKQEGENNEGDEADVKTDEPAEEKVEEKKEGGNEETEKPEGAPVGEDGSALDTADIPDADAEEAAK